MTDVAVVGAGLMGHALALVFALGGHRVRLTDNNPETLRRAPGLMATAMATLAEAGEVDARGADTAWHRCPAACDTWRKPCRRVARGRGDHRKARGQARSVRAARNLDGSRRDPGQQHQQSRHLPAVPEALQPRTSSRTGTRRLTCATWSIWSPEPADRSRRRRDRPDDGRGDGQGARRVQADRAGYVANRIQAAIALEVFRLLDEGIVTPRGNRQFGHPRTRAAHADPWRPRQGGFRRAPLMQHGHDQPQLHSADPHRSERDAGHIVAEGRPGVMAGKGFFDWGRRSPEELPSERDRGSWR